MPALLEKLATVRIASPIDLVRAGEALTNTWFRGQGSDQWQLQSTLERDAIRFGVPDEALLNREKVMCRLFRERAHLYNRDFVAPTSTFEWYALIRHYKGPSRLFGITSSCLVAAYFALSAAPPNTDAAVWAFCFAPQTNLQGSEVDAILEADGTPGVIVAKPSRLNDRMNAQSGGFLVPRSVAVPLQQQVGKTLATDLSKVVSFKSIRRAEEDDIYRVWKLVIRRAMHSELFRFLSRCNVRAYSLFPGLDGLAASLQEMIRVFE